LAQRGHHDHRQVRRHRIGQAPHLLAERKPVDLRQRHVEQDEINPPAPDPGERGRAILHAFHRMPFGFEHYLEQLAYGRIVFHNQDDGVGGRHDGSSPAASAL